jgi:hypothetical protein
MIFFVVGGEFGAGICLNEIVIKIKNEKNSPIFSEPTPPLALIYSCYCRLLYCRRELSSWIK